LPLNAPPAEAQPEYDQKESFIWTGDASFALRAKRPIVRELAADLRFSADTVSGEWTHRHGVSDRAAPLVLLPRMNGGDMLGVLGMLAAKGGGNTDTILWIIAAVLVIAGIVALVRGSVLLGIALIVIGLLVGPGGVSIFD
jgi:hypothetical protein